MQKKVQFQPKTALF